MLSRFGVWSAVALLGAVVLVGCGKESKKQLDPPTVTLVAVTYVVPTAGPATPTAAPAGGASPTTAAPTQAAAGPELNIEAQDISFSTKALAASANTATVIHVKNTGAIVHNFNIDELNIHSGDIQPNATVDVTVNAAAGSYAYYCNIPGHREAGMEGTLTVK